MAKSDSKLPMWAGAMVVMSATSGRVSRAQLEDLAGGVHAQLEDTVVGGSGMRARLSGTPQWLLRLARLATVEA